MGVSTGSAFPTSGINTGHIHYDTITKLSYMYVGGSATDPNNWILVQQGSAEVTQLQNLQGDIGDTSDSAVISPGSAASIIAALKGLLTQLQGNGSGATPADLATSISSEYDSIDVSKMSKAGTITALNAITVTTTSSPIDCRGRNAISVEMTTTVPAAGSWSVEIYGSASNGGPFGPCRESEVNTDLDPDSLVWVAQKTPTVDWAGTYTFQYFFRGVPNWVEVKGVLTGAATLTCKVTPMNL